MELPSQDSPESQLIENLIFRWSLSIRVAIVTCLVLSALAISATFLFEPFDIDWSFLDAEDLAMEIGIVLPTVFIIACAIVLAMLWMMVRRWRNPEKAQAMGSLKKRLWLYGMMRVIHDENVQSEAQALPSATTVLFSPKRTRLDISSVSDRQHGFMSRTYLSILSCWGASCAFYVIGLAMHFLGFPLVSTIVVYALGLVPMCMGCYSKDRLRTALAQIPAGEE